MICAINGGTLFMQLIPCDRAYAIGFLCAFNMYIMFNSSYSCRYAVLEPGLKYSTHAADSFRTQWLFVSVVYLSPSLIPLASSAFPAIRYPMQCFLLAHDAQAVSSICT